MCSSSFCDIGYFFQLQHKGVEMGEVGGGQGSRPTLPPWLSHPPTLGSATAPVCATRGGLLIFAGRAASLCYSLPHQSRMQIVGKGKEGEKGA